MRAESVDLQERKCLSYSNDWFGVAQPTFNTTYPKFQSVAFFDPLKRQPLRLPKHTLFFFGHLYKQPLQASVAQNDPAAPNY